MARKAKKIVLSKQFEEELEKRMFADYREENAKDMQREANC